MKRLISLFLLLSISPLTAAPSQFINWSKDQLSKIDFKKGLSAFEHDSRQLATATYKAIPTKEEAIQNLIMGKEIAFDAILKAKDFLNDNPVVGLFGSALCMLGSCKALDNELQKYSYDQSPIKTTVYSTALLCSAVALANFICRL